MQDIKKAARPNLLRAEWADLKNLYPVWSSRVALSLVEHTGTTGIFLSLYCYEISDGLEIVRDP